MRKKILMDVIAGFLSRGTGGIEKSHSPRSGPKSSNWKQRPHRKKARRRKRVKKLK